MEPVQVFGQPELVEHLASGKPCHSHLISIGNPPRWFKPNRRDTRMPVMFRRHFDAILRLKFYDVEERRHLMRWQFPKRIPGKRDVRRAIRFYRRTRNRATGYTIHCWQGISRSTAFALGYLFMETGSEDAAKDLLKKIRPEAGPHQKIVRFFDDELGSRLAAVNDEIRSERFEDWRRELNLDADDLLEDLPVSEEF